MLALLLAVLLVTGTGFAQQKIAPPKQTAPPKAPVQKPAATSKPCPKEIEPQTCERAWQQLEAAEAESGALRDPGMRAYTQSRIASAYVMSNKGKALQLLADAFPATLDMPQEANFESAQKETLQGQILVALAPLSPERVEELISQARPSPRREAFRALLGYYEKNKRFDAAIEMINRIAGESEFPYEAGTSLMGALPEDKVVERQQLFSAALSSFRTHPPARDVFYFGGDFVEMIKLHWKAVPPALAREAIDEVLKQADTSADPAAEPVRVTIVYQGGERGAFSSMYDWTLFQLLPVLRQLDPAYAESLFKDRPVLAKEFESYAKADARGVSSIAFGNSYADFPRGPDLRADPVAHPEDALEEVLALRDSDDGARVLLSYARKTQERNPTAAKNFLDKAVKTVAPRMKSSREQARVFGDAADLYLKLKDDMGAQNAISAGNAAAEKLYAEDTDSGKPNKALKAYWPSTNAWIRLVRLAGRVSQNSALAMVKQIRDEEIRPVLRIALAGSWIGMPLGSVTVIGKEGGWSQYRDPEIQR